MSFRPENVASGKAQRRCVSRCVDADPTLTTRRPQQSGHLAGGTPARSHALPCRYQAGFYPYSLHSISIFAVALSLSVGSVAAIVVLLLPSFRRIATQLRLTGG